MANANDMSIANSFGFEGKAPDGEDH